MFENEILSPGEKILKLRKFAAISQKDAVTKFTRNNLSNVERGIQELTLEMAKDIADTVMAKAREKGIYIGDITPEFLLMSKNCQANKIFGIMLDKLEGVGNVHDFNDMCKELSRLIDLYKIETNQIFNYWAIAADFYYSRKIYLESMKFCCKALKYSIHGIDDYTEIKFSIKRAKLNIEFKKVDEAIFDLEHAIDLNSKINNNNFRIFSFYNLALCYKIKKDYYSAIKCLDILYTLDIEEYILLKVKLIHANCFNELNRLNDAKKIYSEILDLVSKKNDKELTALMFRNISELYYKMMEIDKAIWYIEESIRIKSIPETLVFAGKLYRNINTPLAGAYFLQALDDNNASKEIKSAAILGLLDIYILTRDTENIMILYDLYNKLDIQNNLVDLLIIKYFLNDNIEKSSQILEKIINKTKKDKEK